MDLGLRYLEDSDWQRADSYFDEVLKVDSKYAPAYIGKLCAELKVPKESQLADLAQPIDENRYFKWAVRDADTAYKRQIQGYADKIKERIGNQKAGDRMVLKIKGVEYAFRWCPSGNFMMGSPQNERDRDDNEAQHQVTLTRGFWMLETEVTQEMWKGVTGSNPSHFKGDKLPVESVSWDDCQEFVEQLNRLKVAPAGFKFSLPTESQWEYACRAGTTTAYHFGNSLSAEQANFDGNVGQTRAVGSYPANAWGLRDMHGNVWEWCLDWYDDYPSGAVADPTGADKGSGRVLRGGSWGYYAGHCRSADRDGSVPSYRRRSYGVRISLVRAE